jgi:hypothetical protein
VATILSAGNGFTYRLGKNPLELLRSRELLTVAKEVPYRVRRFTDESIHKKE